MIDFITGYERTREQRFREARTANDVATTLYPKVAQYYTAFVECEDTITELPALMLMDLNDEFWAQTLGHLGTDTNPISFVVEENQFRRYDPESGIFQPITETTVLGVLTRNLDGCADCFPKRVQHASFIALKSRQRLKAVVARAKDLLSVSQTEFKPKPFTIPVSNGILDVTNGMLTPISPNHLLTATLPVKYSPEANCEVFLNQFLAPVLPREDIDLLQQYLSQILEGHNYSQTILVLTGESGWGKSSLMKIIGSIFGWDQAGIIREQVFKDGCELSHYQGKRFLYHPDMPTEFLHRPEASLFKQLVGGDPIWTETKTSDEMLTIQGNFPVILACNGKPKFNIDSDSDAWLRRLAVVNFGSAAHEQHMGRLAEMIVRREASGILNWLLEGRRKLLQSKLQLTLTEEQRQRSATVLLASDSPKAFVRSCIQKQKDGVIFIADIYEQYQKWCRQTDIRAFSSHEFLKMAKEDIEITYGLRPRHDLQADDGKAKRGWSGLMFINGKADLENTENWSEKSGVNLFVPESRCSV